MRIIYLGYVKDTFGKIKDIIMINIDTLQMVRIPVESVVSTLSIGKRIYGLILENGKLKAEHGNTWADYVEYADVNNGNNAGYIGYLNITATAKKYVVVNEYSVNDKVVAYDIISSTGEKKKVTADKIIDAARNRYFINGCIKNGRFSDYYNIMGYNNIVRIEDAEKESVIAKSNRIEILKTVYPAPLSMSKLQEMDDSTGLTILEKITSAMMVLMDIRPFYYTILKSMTRVETFDIPTLAVSIDRLYINSDFVKKTPLAQLCFVMMHEACHIAMMHNSRRMGRDPETWNIACDYYVNRFICEELGLQPEIKNSVELSASIKKKVRFELVPGGLYDSTVNLDTDTPESIYEKIEQNKNKNGNKNNKNSGNTGDKNDDSDNMSGGNSGNNSEDQDENDGSTDNSGENGSSEVKESRYTDYTGNSDKDTVEDEKSSKMSNQQKQQAQKALNRRIKQTAIQEGLYKGDGAGGLERHVEDAIAEKVDWKTAFRNMLQKKYNEENSFTSPDRRFIGRGVVLPGKKQYEEDGVTHVRIMIDTSGSISNSDITKALKQAEQMMKQYNATAKVSFWDTEVYGEVEIEKKEELNRVKATGGGGTDINCVFRYIQKKEKEKRFDKEDTDIILVWTDGYFGEPANEYKVKYNKNTIFIVNEDSKFEAPFGRKAYFKK